MCLGRVYLDTEFSGEGRICNLQLEIKLSINRRLILFEPRVVWHTATLPFPCFPSVSNLCRRRGRTTPAPKICLYKLSHGHDGDEGAEEPRNCAQLPTHRADRSLTASRLISCDKPRGIVRIPPSHPPIILLFGGRWIVHLDCTRHQPPN